MQPTGAPWPRRVVRAVLLAGGVPLNTGPPWPEGLIDFRGVVLTRDLGDLREVDHWPGAVPEVADDGRSRRWTPWADRAWRGKAAERIRTLGTDGFTRFSSVVSLDSVGDAIVRTLEPFPPGFQLIDSTAAARLWAGLDAFNEILDLTREPLRLLAALDGEEPSSGTVQTLAGALHGVPDSWWPADALAAAIRYLVASVGVRRGAKVVNHLLDLVTPPAALSLDAGLEAQRAAAVLWVKPEDQWPPCDGLDAVSGATLRASEAAASTGAEDVARGRLADALTLMFHRERHAEVESSPLVVDSSRFLDPLTSNPVLRGLRAAPSPLQSGSGNTGTDRKVVVVTGAYGEFHQPVVAALATEAGVRVCDLPRSSRWLRARYLHADFLEVLSRLGRESPVTDHRWDVVAELQTSIAGSDTVFSDWCDRSTVLLSHLVADDQRLVVRLHSLDVLDPWFHLVDWSRVGHVIVVSEPFRRLVTSMLSAGGWRVPVSVVPNVVPVAVMDQEKASGARLTLGMVGWGRRVKDPLWALDLLARDDAWRLVLIGSPMSAGQSAAAQDYTAEVRRRLRSRQLRDRVTVLGQVEDVPGALREVGVILSASRRESWHAGLVEGAASGAVPVVRDWPLLAPVGGAAGVFPRSWVVRDLDEAEARVRRVTEPHVWEQERRLAQDWVRRAFDPDDVERRYREVILSVG